MSNSSPAANQIEQLQSLRRKVDFDTFDVILQQLLSMIESDSVAVAPKYQRKFRWDEIRSSQLIESILLGIPVPSLFMATNQDGTWELVDGVQRVSTIVKFCGTSTQRTKMGLGAALRLDGLEKLTLLNGLTFSELPSSMQLQFNTRPIKVVTLSDKSDEIVRFDLFERLNRGGVSLTDQEIRDCVFRGPFADLLELLTQDSNFGHVVRLTALQKSDGTKEECVLRFFAFLNNYNGFVHSVRDFLNDYMKGATSSFDIKKGEKEFRKTFLELASALPGGIVRPGKVQRNTTPLNLFEGVAVGAALAIRKKGKLNRLNIKKWLGSQKLKGYTTGATNNLAAVKGRIEFCRDRFLGLSDV
jgi:hypothetical protein